MNVLAKFRDQIRK